MPIDVTCLCGRTSSVPDKYAGRKGKCPGCGSVILVTRDVAPGFPDLDLDTPGDPDEAADGVQNSSPSPAAKAPIMSPQPNTNTALPTPAVATIPVRCRCAKVNHFKPEDAGMTGECGACGKSLKIVGPPLVYESTIQRVHLVDAEMPFGSMCWFILKWSLATIPTILLFAVVIFVLRLLTSQ